VGQPDVNTRDVARSLHALFTELVNGAARDGAYVLNRGDVGLVRSLENLDGAAASRPNATGSSIAAHVDHVRYGLSLLNRWAVGDDPWSDADWTASWRKTVVSDAEWKQLIAALHDEASSWARALAEPRDVKRDRTVGAHRQHCPRRVPSRGHPADEFIDAWTKGTMTCG
jgi:hypothetical protein